ncbi:SpoIIE family protein phosphatase [Streptomyces ficellus]|uniref:protein-serine/threonine phosphatase n=1 Tax=Streptomyces ficellus TaxID=1977088 RepID=A0A6I6EYV0_9ACTN|nr:SpoIIE family protein phosphatase [Streptomyces ficellus]QGV76873.1 GAF domain-containing protein [Streptomyces ficellus]
MHHTDGATGAAETAAQQAPDRLDGPLAAVMEETGASVGLVYLLEAEERVLRLGLVAGAPPPITAPWARISLDEAVPVADAVRERRLVWLGGGQEEVARRYPRLGLVLPYDFLLAAAPIAGGGDDALGGLVLLWPGWHPPRLSEREEEGIRTFARRAEQCLRGAPARDGDVRPPQGEPRFVAAPRRRHLDPARAAAALDFTDRMPLGCCALDLDGQITFINTAGAALVGVDAPKLLGRRPWEVLPWLRDPLVEDRYRAAVVARRPTAFTAVRPPDARLLFQLYPDERGISLHISPAATVSSGTTPPAALAPDAPAPATEGETGQEPMGAMGLYHLTHLAAALAEAAGVRDVMELLADQIVPALGPQGLVLMTVEEGRLRIIGHRGYRPEFVARFDGTPLTAAVANAQVLTTGTPVFFASYEEFRRAHPDAPRHEGRSAWAFLPLTASGRSVGSLILSYDRPRPFPPAERALLTSLAGLIAQALDRARLYDAKHALAHTLQTGLLPQTLPPVPGLDVTARYRPAGHGMEIGGDFYDLIHPTPTTVVAAIGDVQGHNVNAAALMGQVRTAVHAHATAGTPPSQLLARTNRLLADLDPGLFTSCLIVQVDLEHRRARLASAGHPPPLLRQPDGGTDVLPVPPGLLLGIEPTAAYPTLEIPFPPGALLLLHTDGLVETPGTDIDSATLNLARHLARHHLDHPGAQSLDDTADSLLRYSERTTPGTDDIALLLLRATRA